MAKKYNETEAVWFAADVAYVAKKAGLKFPLAPDFIKDPGVGNRKLDNRVRAAFNVTDAADAIPKMQKFLRDNKLWASYKAVNPRGAILVGSGAFDWAADLVGWLATAAAFFADSDGLTGQVAASAEKFGNASKDIIKKADTSTKAGRDKAVRELEANAAAAIAEWKAAKAEKNKPAEKPKDFKPTGGGNFDMKTFQPSTPSDSAGKDKKEVSGDTEKKAEEPAWYQKPGTWGAVLGVVGGLGLYWQFVRPRMK